VRTRDKEREEEILFTVLWFIFLNYKPYKYYLFKNINEKLHGNYSYKERVIITKISMTIIP
jgi:hypothetical protein